MIFIYGRWLLLIRVLDKHVVIAHIGANIVVNRFKARQAARVTWNDQESAGRGHIFLEWRATMAEEVRSLVFSVLFFVELGEHGGGHPGMPFLKILPGDSR